MGDEMRAKVYECSRCGTELCVGDKMKWIEQRPICLDCSLIMRYERFKEWDEDYNDITIKESDKF